MARKLDLSFGSDGDQVIVNAEVKTGDTPSAVLLREATAAAFADEQRS